MVVVNFNVKFKFLLDKGQNGVGKGKFEVVNVVMEMVVKKVFVIVERNVLYWDLLIENLCILDD